MVGVSCGMWQTTDGGASWIAVYSLDLCSWEYEAMRTHLAFCLVLSIPITAAAQPLPGTKPLESKDDLARVMLDGIHRYLDKATVLAAKDRAKYWKPDFSSVQAFDKSVAGNRERFRKMIGVIDARV